MPQFLQIRMFPPTREWALLGRVGGQRELLAFAAKRSGGWPPRSLVTGKTIPVTPPFSGARNSFHRSRLGDFHGSQPVGQSALSGDASCPTSKLRRPIKCARMPRYCRLRISAGINGGPLGNTALARSQQAHMVDLAGRRSRRPRNLSRPSYSDSVCAIRQDSGCGRRAFDAQVNPAVDCGEVNRNVDRQPVTNCHRLSRLRFVTDRKCVIDQAHSGGNVRDMTHFPLRTTATILTIRADMPAKGHN
jgi:hypothetical protein